MLAPSSSILLHLLLLSLSTSRIHAQSTVYINAIGMGVTSKSASTKFYSKLFGAKKSLSMPVANMGQGGWTEDIDVFPADAHSSALVLMEWTDKRSVKNLPVKLTFAVGDPVAKGKEVVAEGGSAAVGVVGVDGKVFVRDLDGYLLELVKSEGTGPSALKDIGIGVSNLNASAAWWAGATGLAAGPVARVKDWASVILAAGKGSKLSFMEWHEEPKRPTKNMPIKIVLAASSTGELTKSIQRQSPKGTKAGSMAMFQWEPLEHTLIEINSAKI